jgi:lia operon protein LiaF
MKRWQIFLGLLLIVLGLFSLFELVFHINLWRFVGPLLLVALGVWLILRPQMAGPDVKVQMPIFGDIRKTGVWEATNHEIWMLAGNSRLDFTDASFPNGEATIRIIGFVADVKVILPEDVGLFIESSAIVSELKGITNKEERLFNTLEYATPEYQSASKKVKLQTVAFVSTIKLKRPLI